MAEMFDTEVKAYGRLKPLQGVVVPVCYGCIQYDRTTRALLLEYLEGVPLSSPEGGTLSLEELSDLLHPCYRALHAFGVHHRDPNLYNYQLVDGKMKVLDLESINFDLAEDFQTKLMNMGIRCLAEKYRDMQAEHRSEGLLEAAA